MIGEVLMKNMGIWKESDKVMIKDMTILSGINAIMDCMSRKAHSDPIILIMITIRINWKICKFKYLNINLNIF